MLSLPNIPGVSTTSDLSTLEVNTSAKDISLNINPLQQFSDTLSKLIVDFDLDGKADGENERGKKAEYIPKALTGKQNEIDGGSTINTKQNSKRDEKENKNQTNPSITNKEKKNKSERNQATNANLSDSDGSGSENECTGHTPELPLTTQSRKRKVDLGPSERSLKVKKNDILVKEVKVQFETVFNKLVVPLHSSQADRMIETFASLSYDVPLRCLQALSFVDDCTSQLIAQTFVYLLQRDSQQVISYFEKRKKEITEAIADMLRRNDMSLFVNSVLRNVLSVDCIYIECLYFDDLAILKELISQCCRARNFLSCGILEMLLKKDRYRVTLFLSEYSERFFNAYMRVLKCENNALLCRVLKLLSDLILDKNNLFAAKSFLGNDQNLLAIMKLLMIPNKNVNIEAFHILKVFIANPEKNKEIVHILTANCEGLVMYIKELIRENEQDKMALAEKALIIKVLTEMVR